MNSLYLGFIQRMVTDGSKRKDNSWSYVNKNKALLEMTQTNDLISFVKTQQRDYVELILLQNNANIVKRILFNNDTARKPGPQTKLLSSILKGAKYTMKEFMETAKSRKITYIYN